MVRRLTALATFLLVAFAILATLAIATYAFDAVTERHQRGQVDEYSRRALQRAELVTDDAEAALRALSQYDGPPCTPEHLRLLRQAEAGHRYVRGAAWNDGESHGCSTLPEAGTGALPPPELALPGGYTAWRSRAGKPGSEQQMLNIRYGNHIVVVDPRFYLDIVPLDDTIEIGLLETHNTLVIARWANAEPEVIRTAVRDNLTSTYADGRYYVVERSSRYPIAIVAYEPEDRIRPSWLRQMKTLILPALIASTLIAWLAVAWRRRQRTPRSALLEGIRRRQFVAWFQPVVELESGRCVGAEALVRWQLGDGSIIAPDSFIPMAEQIGLIQPITDLVIRSVFEGVGELLAARRDFHISINLTPDDLETSRMMETLQACLDKYHVHGSQIWFEAIERAFIDARRFARVLDRYRAQGHRVLIDDFGTGYSNLAYLQELPVDGIKIDKAFIHALTTGAEVNVIVPHIIAMAQSLGLAMVAEGVETDAQAEWLRNHGVQFGQGWRYAKAMPAAEFVRYASAAPMPQRTPGAMNRM
ncbi:EAL domain-containing protein [Paraburkholderia ferrariae]|uniref:EAL domain-containing protein n=1 Tax=Paraburkholderia ferrariae TaxID=386056 RepID=UPI000482E523|nr:EAL domain-containing protein [Paraburkholderia ferrariae]